MVKVSSLPFKVKVETIDSNLMITVSGAIDSTFSSFINQMSPLFPKFHQIQIEMGELTHINSAGIREWIRMMILLKDRKTIFKRCPVFIIRQANMVDGFLNYNTIVDSFYVNYFCDNTESEISVLFERNKHYGKGFNKIPDSITQDGQIFSIEIIRSTFFEFLDRHS